VAIVGKLGEGANFNRKRSVSKNGDPTGAEHARARKLLFNRLLVVICGISCHFWKHKVALKKVCCVTLQQDSLAVAAMR
jgi:hypothetical protein